MLVSSGREKGESHSLDRDCRRHALVIHFKKQGTPILSRNLKAHWCVKTEVEIASILYDYLSMDYFKEFAMVNFRIKMVIILSTHLEVPRISEVEAGRVWVPGHPWLHETLHETRQKDVHCPCLVMNVLAIFISLSFKIKINISWLPVLLFRHLIPIT